MTQRIAVTATDLIAWAQKRRSQELLPVLIRKLVYATGRGVRRVGFPAFESVQHGGWDGIVVASEPDAHVPQGTSAWELGTGTDARAKAKSDYDKRSKDPRGVTPDSATLVLLTLQRFPDKEAWIAERTHDAAWAEVRVYDANDVEQWLERAPAVTSWFAELIGRRPDDAWELGSHWLDWAATTEPHLPPGLLLAGRAREASEIVSWFEGGEQTLTVSAGSSEEALAVVEAAIEQLPADARDGIHARTLVVSSDAAWQRLARSEIQLTLIPAVDGLEPGAALRHRHRVIIPAAGVTSSGANVVHIPRLSSDAARDALISAGIAETRAQNLAPVARRNLFALRRALAAPGALKPAWHVDPKRRLLLPLLLLSRWNEEYDGDRKAVESLAGAPYPEVQDLLLRLEVSGDPPARRIGAAWRVGSVEDLWEGLGPLLAESALEHYVGLAVRILVQPDSQFDLDTAERLAARWNSEQVQPEFSKLLQGGVAEALAFLGSRGVDLPKGTYQVSDYVRRIVWQAFQQMRGALPVAVSLANRLSDLVEAAPDEVLRAIDEDLRSGAPTLAELFAERKDVVFSSSTHVGLLWGLERLAWSAQYLTGVCVQLARLARLDPGGQLRNRPANSLTDIFREWLPATAASLDERLRALDVLRREQPQVTWELLISLLPAAHGFAMRTALPRWRDWAGEGYRDVPYSERLRAVEQVMDRILADVGPISVRWKPVIEALAHLPPHLIERSIEQLESLPANSATDQDRESVSHSLRAILSRHRSLENEEQRLPEELLVRLERLLQSLEPSGSARRHAWLFTWFPDLPDGRGDDVREHRDAAQDAQDAAARELVSQGGLQALLDCAALAAEPQMVGAAAGRACPLADEATWLQLLLTSEAPTERRFVGAYLGARFDSAGWDWADSLLSKVKGKWAAQEVATLLQCLPNGAQVWNRAAELGGAAEKAYWGGAFPFGIAIPEEREVAARKLLQFGRPLAAVELLALYVNSKNDVVDHELIATALEGAAASDGVEKPLMPSFDYHVGHLLDLLVTGAPIDEERLAVLEWKYLPLFRYDRRRPTALFRRLQGSPSFFVELVTLAYRPDEGEVKQQSGEQEARRVDAAADLLRVWREPPILSLTDWVAEARRQLTDRGFSKSGDYAIGHLLSGSGVGEDAAWPHEAVRNVIEAAQSDPLERAFSTGVYNSRGVFSKGVYEGGNAERAIADRYETYASVVTSRWPRTGAILRSIAETYRRDARREDQDAEAREDS